MAAPAAAGSRTGKPEGPREVVAGADGNHAQGRRGLGDGLQGEARHAVAADGYQRAAYRNRRRRVPGAVRRRRPRR